MKNTTFPRSRIPWCTHGWSIITGCSPASSGCRNCYAAALARRFHRPWGAPEYNPAAIEMPSNTQKPCVVFVAPTSDLWHPELPERIRSAILLEMLLAPHHQYIMLTKRPRLQAMNVWEHDEPANWWPGISAEDQLTYNLRSAAWRSNPPSRWILSAEPLLGPITLQPDNLPCWVIAGPETGPGARPCNPNWLRSLAIQCGEHNIPFFDKRPDTDPQYIWRHFPIPILDTFKTRATARKGRKT